MNEKELPRSLKIPELKSAGKLLALVHQCKGSVYLTGDGFSLCLTSMLCRYVAVDKIIRNSSVTQVELAFTDEADYEAVNRKLKELASAEA